MRLTSSLAYTRAAPVPKMPPGLVELMEGLTKDVLKNNPSNVYEFCANHLEKLLEMRDGSSPGKSATLEEKIAKAQEKVKQRAKERQQQYDNEVQRNVKNDVPENNDSGKVQNAAEQELVSNLRAPVHHDQELSLYSEVEISHEPTDNNSLTSKDSYFDESDDIPISKSSTISSVSKSTVIDLMAGNEHESFIKENIDDGTENIEIPGIEINTDERVEENEVVNAHTYQFVEDENIALHNIEINNDEPVKESIVFDDQKDEISIDINTEPSSDDHDKIQENIVSLATKVDEDESHPAVAIPDKNNLAKELDNTLKHQPSDLVKNVIESDQENNLKSLHEVNATIEDDENAIKVIELINYPTTEIKTDITVEEVQNHIEDSTIEIADGNITNDNPNELISTDNVNDEESEKNQVNNNAAESLNTTSQPELVNNSANILTSDHTDDCNPNEISKEVNVDEEKIPTPDSIEKHNIVNEPEGVDVNIDADEKKEFLRNKNTEASTHKTLLNLKQNLDDNDDLDEKLSRNLFPGDEEKVSKEENANSSSISNEITGSLENNDDSSVMGSDLSKADDDINRSDNENGKNNMDLETAAETIQKVFRSFLFKSRNSTFEDITNDDETSLEEDNDKNKDEYYATANLSKERRPLGITRMDTVLQTVNEEKSLSLSTDDSSTLSSAATTIQAHVRGFLVRNRLNSYKTVSTNSLVNSNEILDTDTEQLKNKTVLNIHIVPEEGNYLSRDESLITSIDLSLDESPPSSINLHPLSYDLVSERRKLLKREDAIQSVSPPSNNSGKLSEDSVKEVLNENDVLKTESNITEKDQLNPENNSPETLVTAVNAVTVRDTSNEHEDNETAEKRKRCLSSDESDVVTPYVASPRSLVGDFDNTSKLIHSGEFHDIVLPTKVSRSDTTVVRGE